MKMTSIFPERKEDDLFNTCNYYRALYDWHLAPSKDYEAFARKYPMNGELKQQLEKIYAMRDWCNAVKIRATPTIYVNGRTLPDTYRVADLSNFF